MRQHSPRPICILVISKSILSTRLSSPFLCSLLSHTTPHLSLFTQLFPPYLASLCLFLYSLSLPSLNKPPASGHIFRFLRSMITSLTVSLHRPRPDEFLSVSPLNTSSSVLSGCLGCVLLDDDSSSSRRLESFTGLPPGLVSHDGGLHGSSVSGSFRSSLHSLWDPEQGKGGAGGGAGGGHLGPGWGIGRRASYTSSDVRLVLLLLLFYMLLLFLCLSSLHLLDICARRSCNLDHC